MSTLSINCFLLGTDSSRIFTVEIPKTENVSILKDLIKEEQSPHLNHIDASELTVWKVSLPEDAISPELTVDGVKALHPLKKISSIFGEALVDEHLPIPHNFSRSTVPGMTSSWSRFRRPKLSASSNA
ncbi:hypothetical protein B0F90DRAFT_1717476 [Multifurca ochricompacta]|uniref:Crinkler effector protein N-terminal domain-containing protein n=1 Tax=Multifurca ochricompacta TaxID=376703 RepID=A0AAD4M6V3_9AGAM|nr:hypothetical protein B0F90DRAFT_1717476 [Multifurca ochricompacta]